MTVLVVPGCADISDMNHRDTQKEKTQTNTNTETKHESRIQRANKELAWFAQYILTNSIGCMGAVTILLARD